MKHTLYYFGAAVLAAMLLIGFLHYVLGIEFTSVLAAGAAVLVTGAAGAAVC